VTRQPTPRPLRLGPHHFAHLRAVAEGIEVQDSGRRYLGIEHGHEAVSAHRLTVDAVRAVARRRGEPAWRLIGLTIRPAPCDPVPSLEDFMAMRGLDGWSESEVIALYAEAYPSDARADTRAERRHRLRRRQLELLARLQAIAAESPQPGDAISGWFDERTAAKLMNAGFMTLWELQTRLAIGGRWYASLPGIGPTKAGRIARHLELLLGPAANARPREFPGFELEERPLSDAPVRPGAAAGTGQTEAVEAGDDRFNAALTHWAGEGETAVRRPVAQTDQEAAERWIEARAGSIATAKVYRREATRLLLWLQYERGGLSLDRMEAADCRDYMAFLQHLPPHWISRVRAQPGQPGWAPFRGPLSHSSHRQAVTIIAGWFAWLQSARYLAHNPWLLINQKTGDDRTRRLLDTKALSEGAMSEVLRFIDAQPASPARERIRFLVRFVEAVGLRSAEILNAKLGDFSLELEGWMLQVHGKGARNRLAAVPQQAVAALQRYLESRGLGSLQSAPPEAPLLASVLDPMQPVGYQALYEHVRTWLRKAVDASQLSLRERQNLARVSTHWLRHTFGTRAIAREVPLDVIQAQMGHASIQTTTSIYGRAPIRRRSEELDKAFG
jgi:integrase